MAAKKTPRSPAPTAGRVKKAHAPAKPVRESKGAKVKAIVANAPPKPAPITKKPSNAPTRSDPFALPALPDLPDLAPLPDLADPYEEAASDLRVFGEELDESPITEYTDEELERMTNEQLENQRMAELHAGFRERARKEAKRFELATDSEYWVCVVFQDRDQKDEFLRRANWEKFGDKYIDGELLAKHLGVKVTPSEIAYNLGGTDPKLAQLTDIDPLNPAKRRR